ncbi:MAG: hypothetical protein JST69_00230 [Bacteroidetes bacterium]|nr:hypothetical protein [Bacteroidota bacterium]
MKSTKYNLITITITICLIASLTLTGQNFSKKTTLFLVAGPTYLNIRGAKYSSFFVQKGKEKLGYTLGLGLTHHIGKHVFLNTRFLLERKRFEIDYVNYNSNILTGWSNQDFSKYYMTIAVIPQFVLGKHFNLGLGFFVSRFVKSTVDVQSYNLIVFGSSLNQTSNYDQGFSLTAGYTLPFRHLIFTVQLTDNYGLQNVIPSTAIDPWYFNSYSILLGFNFNKTNDLK